VDLNKLTMKSQAALQEAQQQAVSRNRQTIEPDHLLFALLSDAEGTLFPLLDRLEVSPVPLRQRVDEALDRLPKVFTGGAVDVRISPATGRVLDAAGREAEALTDEYISTEHLFLALLADDGSAGRILREAGLARDAVLAALAEVRGRQRVTDQNP
jgi:ATP-dependent Clp protease ATP-binding subunit ClpB